MEIRSPTPPELQICETVLRAAFKPFASRLGRELRGDAFFALRNTGPEKHVLVAVYDLLIGDVAVFSVGKDTWIIEQVAMNPIDQGKGIGSVLIQRIERDAVGVGVPMLESDTSEIITDLLPLYRRHGFATARKGPPKYGLDRFTRVYMQKVI